MQTQRQPLFRSQAVLLVKPEVALEEKEQRVLRVLHFLHVREAHVLRLQTCGWGCKGTNHHRHIGNMSLRTGVSIHTKTSSDPVGAGTYLDDPMQARTSQHMPALARACMNRPLWACTCSYCLTEASIRKYIRACAGQRGVGEPRLSDCRRHQALLNCMTCHVIAWCMCTRK